MQRGFCGMLRSACWNEVPMHLLHTDKWGEDGLKFTMLVAFLDLMLEKSKATGKRYVVMLIDAFDTLLQAKPDDILQRYLKSGNDVIVSGEASCFAGPWDFPLCNLNAKPCELFEHGERRWPRLSHGQRRAAALSALSHQCRIISTITCTQNTCFYNI